MTDLYNGRDTFPVGRPDFKSGWGRETVPSGFDSHSLPPYSLKCLSRDDGNPAIYMRISRGPAFAGVTVPARPDFMEMLS